GRHGANSAGIALNANGLGTRWGKGIGVPQPIIRRKILESSDMQTALRAVFDSRQSLCTNLLITHRDGFAIDLETTPDRHGWMYPTDGLLVHTNHLDRKSTRLNSSHVSISYAVFCLKKKKIK